MDGWVKEECMDGWMGGWIDGWKDEKLKKNINK